MVFDKGSTSNAKGCITPKMDLEFLKKYHEELLRETDQETADGLLSDHINLFCLREFSQSMLLVLLKKVIRLEAGIKGIEQELNAISKTTR